MFFTYFSLPIKKLCVARPILVVKVSHYLALKESAMVFMYIHNHIPANSIHPTNNTLS